MIETRVLIVTSYFDSRLRGIYTTIDSLLDFLPAVLPTTGTYDLTGDLTRWECDTFPIEELQRLLMNRDAVRFGISSDDGSNTFEIEWMFTDEPLKTFN